MKRSLFTESQIVSILKEGCPLVIIDEKLWVERLPTNT